HRKPRRRQRTRCIHALSIMRYGLLPLTRPELALSGAEGATLFPLTRGEGRPLVILNRFHDFLRERADDFFGLLRRVELRVLDVPARAADLMSAGGVRGD